MSSWSGQKVGARAPTITPRISSKGRTVNPPLSSFKPTPVGSNQPFCLANQQKRGRQGWLPARGVSRDVAKRAVIARISADV